MFDHAGVGPPGIVGGGVRPPGIVGGEGKAPPRPPRRAGGARQGGRGGVRPPGIVGGGTTMEILRLLATAFLNVSRNVFSSCSGV